MQIKYSPQQNDNLSYKVVEEVVFIKYLTNVKKVDFSNFADGMMNEPIDFISTAEKINGELIVTLLQPVDNSGNPIEQEDFDISDYEEIQVFWKTQEEIEAEKNAPKPPTPDERLQALEDTVLALMME